MNLKTQRHGITAASPIDGIVMLIDDGPNAYLTEPFVIAVLGREDSIRLRDDLIALELSEAE